MSELTDAEILVEIDRILSEVKAAPVIRRYQYRSCQVYSLAQVRYRLRMRYTTEELECPDQLEPPE